jgi:hypothetical protein
VRKHEVVEVIVQIYTTDFLSWERDTAPSPDTRYIGWWVDPTTALDALKQKETILSVLGIENISPQNFTASLIRYTEFYMSFTQTEQNNINTN